MPTVELAAALRIASFSIALFDLLQTIPAEFRLYRRQFQNGRVTTTCFLFMVARYVGAFALITNGIGYFGTDFTEKQCEQFYLLPVITKMIAGEAAQGIIFIRTYAIAHHSKRVLISLSVLLILCIPAQVIGNVYRREAVVMSGNCTSRKTSPDDWTWAAVYYLANLVFDVAACGMATWCIIRRSNGVRFMAQFSKRVLKHGLIYAFATTITNFLVFLSQLDLPVIKGLGATLSIAITMIMAQHLVLATQNSRDLSFELEQQSTSSTDMHSRGTSLSRKHRRASASGGAANGGGFRTRRVELSGVHVRTETHSHTDAPAAIDDGYHYHHRRRSGRRGSGGHDEDFGFGSKFDGGSYGGGHGGGGRGGRSPHVTFDDAGSVDLKSFVLSPTRSSGSYGLEDCADASSDDMGKEVEVPRLPALAYYQQPRGNTFDTPPPSAV